MKVARIMEASPALVPWIIFISVAAVCWRERELFKGYVRARIDAHRESARFSASYAELVRNNTAALENNTAALRMVQNDRDRLESLLMHHDKLVEDRLANLQSVASKIDETATRNSHNLALIEDRTDK